MIVHESNCGIDHERVQLRNAVVQELNIVRKALAVIFVAELSVWLLLTQFLNWQRKWATCHCFCWKSCQDGGSKWQTRDGV